jgi:hypothetical protein
MHKAIILFSQESRDMNLGPPDRCTRCGVYSRVVPVCTIVTGVSMLANFQPTHECTGLHVSIFSPF